MSYHIRKQGVGVKAVVEMVGLFFVHKSNFLEYSALGGISKSCASVREVASVNVITYCIADLVDDF